MSQSYLRVKNVNSRLSFASPENVAKGSRSSGGRGVGPLFASFWSARRRVVIASPSQVQNSTTVGSAERVRLMTCDALLSLALRANRSVSSSTCRFAAQAKCF